MRVVQDGERLVVRDRPGGMWLLGLMFVASGTFATAIGAGLLEMEGDVTGWARLAVLAIGLGHLGGGVYVLRQAHATEVVIDRARGVLVVRARGVRRDEAETVRLSDVTRLELFEEKDGDGDLTYTLRLRLTGDRAVPLHAIPVRTPNDLAAQAGLIQRFLRLPEPPRSPRLPGSSSDAVS